MVANDNHATVVLEIAGAGRLGVVLFVDCVVLM
jgi:hypothetical protein